MVDLQATNLKLKDRSERILMETCGISRDDARTLLDAAGGSVKVGIVMHRTKVERDEAVKRIQEAGGLIRRVVGDP
jgi:N-acetylmuramic acid 6-phosphate etherase